MVNFWYWTAVQDQAWFESRKDCFNGKKSFAVISDIFIVFEIWNFSWSFLNYSNFPARLIELFWDDKFLPASIIFVKYGFHTLEEHLDWGFLWRGKGEGDRWRLDLASMLSPVYLFCYFLISKIGILVQSNYMDGQHLLYNLFICLNWTVTW